MKILHSAKAPTAIGPYSQAIMIQGNGNFVEVSGQLGVDQVSGELVSDNVEQQTIQAIANIRNILEEANLNLSDIVKTTVYLTDLDNDFPIMNRVYAELFGEHKPTRVTVGVAALPRGGKVEIQATAWKVS